MRRLRLVQPVRRYTRVRLDHLTAYLRECWILKDNLRVSGTSPSWTTEPTIHAIVVETIEVDEKERRQGHLKRFLAELCEDRRFEMVVVEGVGNLILAGALQRWGWDFDPKVMDFYYRVPVAVES